jgi:hypothetical protein
MSYREDLVNEICNRIMKDLDPSHELSFDELGFLVEAIKSGRKVEVRRDKDGKPEVFISRHDPD